ncbi:MAG TPA: hypothetical protein VGP72_12210, partial [Planctomycetota bacterium]
TPEAAVPCQLTPTARADAMQPPHVQTGAFTTFSNRLIYRIFTPALTAGNWCESKRAKRGFPPS